jgi:hypothetical protein
MNDTGQRVAIGHTNRSKIQFGRLPDHLMWMRCAP